MIPGHDCSTCAFSDLAFSEDDEPMMECHRYPPTVVEMDDDHAHAAIVFPSVTGDSWCGEWKAPEP